MTRNRSQLNNFVNYFLGTIKFGNDQIVKITGYDDYQIGNVTISCVYYVRGLGHNLFFVGQVCDSDLEVAFHKHTCFVCNLEGVDLLSGSQGTNFCILSIGDMMKSSPICLLSKASKTKKTPYELLHDRKPDLSYLHLFGALCYPTNDSEDQGKLKTKADVGIVIGYAPAKKAYRIYNRRTTRIMETIHVDFDGLTAMDSEQSTSRPTLHEMTPRTLCSGLVPQPPSLTLFVPPIRNDWDTLFQPFFNEYFNPPSCVDHPVSEVAASDVVVLTGTPSSTFVVKMHHHQVALGLREAFHLLDLDNQSFTLEGVTDWYQSQVIENQWVSDEELEAPKEALPSPDYVLRPEYPSSPYYMPGLEHAPSPIYVPYVPEPEYSEYLVPSDAEAPIEDQPLPDDASPTSLSPCYIVDFDPEEDPADYPADEKDDDDDESSDDDDDDNVKEDEEEEEEHLALADSSVVPIDDHIPSAQDTEAFETDEFLALPTPPPSPLTPLSSPQPQISSPPLPVSSPLLPLPSPPTSSPTYVEAPLGYRVAAIRMRAASPPLLLPYTSHRTDISEAETPPHKKACFNTPDE
nr:integrase, catalytic region, zinc finger, CCHC-type, peptidase aspartic, catalytic [Tanacetum cinerariifolium]